MRYYDYENEGKICMKVFSLFTGIGGFDLAMRNLGHEIVGACEIDKYARETYKKHFPKVPIHENAKEIKAEELPDFDVLCAGFPCQAFSIAGKRKGFSDTRGSLFFEIARIAKEKQPSILFLENVKGLFNHDKGETFRTILNTLDEVGYDAEWQLHNSKHFVPQNRERIFIIGHLREKRIRQIFPIGSSNKKSNSSSGKTQGKGERVRSPHTRTIDANYWKGGSHGSLLKRVGYAIKKVGMLTDNPNNAVLSPDGISSTILSGEDSGSRTNVVVAKTSRDFVYLSNTNANMKQREQKRSESWTLGTGTDFGIKDGIKIRRLTPLECERLQGFPDNWTEGVSDTQRYKQIGNAVTVPVVQYIAENFIYAEDNE